MSKITCTRYHDMSCGHRVAGHEGKCRHLHGHNYRIHFTCEAEAAPGNPNFALDSIGRVIDFSEVKSRLCMWLEDNWDHKFLHWEYDPLMSNLLLPLEETKVEHYQDFKNSLVAVPFNPTAENMANYLLQVIGPRQLQGTGIRLVKVTIEETAKCSASVEVRR